MTNVYQPTGTYLDRILAQTASDLLARKATADLADLERRGAGRTEPVSLESSLRRPGTAVISEFKRASPSKGEFAFAGTLAEVIGDYIEGGAAGLSVLTDGPFFQGSMADLTAAAALAHVVKPPVPVLRKDFILDEFQILEARAIGADALLLIVAALSQKRLEQLLAATAAAGLEALVEVHTEDEMQRAADAGARIIGINNRDLHSFVVDLAVTERVAPLRPKDLVLVGESGIFTRADVERLEAAGVDAILVGESLIISPDRAAALRQLRGGPS